MPALLASALFPFSAFLFICLPGGFCTSPNRLYTVRGPQGLLRVSALLRDSVSAFRPACIPLSPFLLVTMSAFSLLSPFVSGLVSLLVGHCVRFVPFCYLGLPSCLPSCWSPCPPCRHCMRLVSLLFPFVSLLVSLLVGHCVRLVSLLFPFVSLLVDVSKCGRNASLLSHLFGVYGGVICSLLYLQRHLAPTKGKAHLRAQVSRWHTAASCLASGDRAIFAGQEFVLECTCLARFLGINV